MGSLSKFKSSDLGESLSRGVERDHIRTKYYYGLAAMNGHVISRHIRAKKAQVDAAKAEDKGFLDNIKRGFMGDWSQKRNMNKLYRAYKSG